MMRKIFKKSIYIKFASLFLVIWWSFTLISIGLIKFVIRENFTLIDARAQENLHQLSGTIDLTLVITGVLGTIAILVAVRSIVKPIQDISKASKEVAKGNFDHRLSVCGEDEIATLCRDFNAMTESLKGIGNLHENFVSNVSHEFRTPITAIKGYAKLIESESPKDQSIYQYANVIVEESERLSLLSSNLLKISELDSHILKEAISSFRLDEQLRKVVLLLEHLWGPKEISFELDLPKTVVNSDEDLLKEVWLNLIQNAIKFSENQTTIGINIEGENADGMLTVSIKDHGIGMEEDQKQRIFERFYKADSSRSGQGNGLGLVIVQKILQFLHGSIDVESQVNHGTTFYVQLKSYQ